MHLEEKRKSAIPMDITYDSDGTGGQDILSPCGFANMVYQMLRVRMGGAAFTAPVCSSWVFMTLGVVEGFKSIFKNL